LAAALMQRASGRADMRYQRACGLPRLQRRGERQHAVDRHAGLQAQRRVYVDFIGMPVSSTWASPARPFMAIQGQCAQLLQVALLPAVGAS
jgi:hypothetical protein